MMNPISMNEKLERDKSRMSIHDCSYVWIHIHKTKNIESIRHSKYEVIYFDHFTLKIMCLILS